MIGGARAGICHTCGNAFVLGCVFTDTCDDCEIRMNQEAAASAAKEKGMMSPEAMAELEKPKDARRVAMKESLNQLSIQHLLRLHKTPEKDLCLDTYAYDESYGTRCPLAYALDLHAETDRRMRAEIQRAGFRISAMSGTPGEFYTVHRYADLIDLVEEIIVDRVRATNPMMTR